MAYRRLYSAGVSAFTPSFHIPRRAALGKERRENDQKLCVSGNTRIVWHTELDFEDGDGLPCPVSHIQHQPINKYQ